MNGLPRTPVGARQSSYPIGGTLILVMMPDHFTTWPSWVWPVLWTLWALVWVIVLVDVIGRTPIPDAKWREVFK